MRQAASGSMGRSLDGFGQRWATRWQGSGAAAGAPPTRRRQRARIRPRAAGGDRVLSGIKFASVGQHAVTNTKCVAYCSAAGYSMAGTEYGGQCFCGNALVGSQSVADAQCDMPCEGDNAQTCGGSLTLSVYSTSSKSRRALRHMHRHIEGFAS